MANGENKWLHTYSAEDGTRWVVYSENGNKVAGGLQGYSNLQDAKTITKQLFGRPILETKTEGQPCGMGHNNCTIARLQNRSTE